MGRIDSIFKPEAQARIDRKGGLEMLHKMDSEDHAGTRLHINDWLSGHQSEVAEQKKAAEAAEIQRALNAVQSKMKVEEREAAKASPLHSFHDSFQHSEQTDEPLNAKKMAAFMAGFQGLA